LTNKVYLMDCMEWMAGLPDNYADLAIVDPPYGINAGKMQLGTGRHEYKKSNWDKIIPGSKYFFELSRVSKNQIISGGNYFTKFLSPNNNWIIWDKLNPNMSFSEAELIWSSIKKNIKIFKFCSANLKDGKKIHPTQKPTALYRWLLLNYANPGWKIIDTHVGSGSIRIACAEMGFNFEGTELDPDYWQEQENRYLDYISQGNLFDTEEIQNLTYKEKENFNDKPR